MKQKQQQKQCGESLLKIDINQEIMEISDKQYFALVQNIL